MSSAIATAARARKQGRQGLGAFEPESVNNPIAIENTDGNDTSGDTPDVTPDINATVRAAFGLDVEGAPAVPLAGPEIVYEREDQIARGRAMLARGRKIARKARRETMRTVIRGWVGAICWTLLSLLLIATVVMVIMGAVPWMALCAEILFLGLGAKLTIEAITATLDLAIRSRVLLRAACVLVLAFLLLFTSGGAWMAVVEGAVLYLMVDCLLGAAARKAMIDGSTS